MRSVGQTFVLPSGSDTILTEFAFALKSATDASLSYRAYLFRWDTANLKATGSPLFTSSLLNGQQTPSFKGLNIVLSPGVTYIAMLTTEGVANDGYANGLAYHNSADVYSGGAAYQQNSPISNGSSGSGSWTTLAWNPTPERGDFQFSAKFGVSPADLTIVKSHSGNFTQGQSSALFSLAVSNIGGMATSGQISATDTLPIGLTPVSASGTGWSCSVSGQTATCTRTTTISPNESAPAITLSVAVASNAPGTVANTASVSGGSEQGTSNNSSTDTVTINAAPDLTVTKVHSGTFTQGQTGIYRITVSNTSTVATSGQVSISDTLPDGLTPNQASGNGWSCSTTGKTINCSRSDSLAGGQSFPTINLTVNIASNAPNNVTNSTVVSGGGDVTSGNNSASDPTSIQSGTDLTITKSHSGNFIRGQQGTYTLTVKNIGTGDTTNALLVTDTIPAGLTPVSISGTGWNCSAISGQTTACQRSELLAAGATFPSLTLVVLPTASAPASVTNTATVSGGGDNNSSNNSASDVTTILDAPDLTVVKSHTGNFTQGQSPAAFSLTVSNVGSTATVGQVFVTDTLPAGLNPLSASGTGWSCSITGQAVSCNRTDALAASATFPIIALSVGVAGNAAATITNTASVAGGTELNDSNNSSSDTVTVNPAPNLTISKTHTGTFIQGQTGAYTITVNNIASVATSGQVSITDALPIGLTPTAASGTGWSCSIESRTVNCSRTTSLPSGQNFPPITLTVNVASNAAASLTNTVTVSGGGDVTPGNNSASDITAIGNGPDLTISKSHSGVFVEGQTGTFTIVVSNSGPAATPSGATTVVSDTLPASLAPVNAAGTGWFCSISIQTMTCSRTDSLSGGASYPPITLTTGVSLTARGAVTNTVTVSGGGDVNTSNNSASDPVVVVAGPDLQITKNHTGDFNQGESGSAYRITVFNTGPSASIGTVAIQDVLPTGLSPGSLNAPGWNCSTAGQTVNCSRSDTLNGNSSYPTITLTVFVAPNAPSSVTNTVTVSGGGDVDSNNNIASDLTTIVPQPDLTISKSHAGDFTQGQMGAYSIVVTNSGAGATSGTVTVADTVPTGLTPISAAGTGWTCSTPSGRTVTCSRSDVLAANSSYPPITLTVDVANDAPASVTNVAVVAGNDVNPSNNTASDPTTVRAGPDLAVTKSHSGSFRQGQQGATYSIVATNIGPTPTTKAVAVVDTVPDGLTPVSASGTGWNCTISGQILTCGRTDALAGNAAYPSITLTVNVANNAPDSVMNTVTVSGGGDVNSTNNTTSDPTHINQLPDLTISKSHTGDFTQGQTGATYTIVVTNSGSGSTIGTVTVEDILPSDLNLTLIRGIGWTCDLPRGVGVRVLCIRSDPLAPSKSYAPLTLTASVASNAAASVTNIASVSTPLDVDPNNNIASDPTTIGAGPDLTISKAHSGNFNQGQQGATYSLVVRNSGPAPTTGPVSFSDTLPTGLTPTAASGSGWNCGISGQDVTCARTDTLAGNTNYPSVTLAVNVAINAPSSVTNTAAVTGGGDVNPSNNNASDPTTIVAQPDLTISKSHTGNFTQGQTGAAYTIVVSNSGAGATSGTVTVSDAVPSGLTPIAASGNGWTCGSPSGQAVNCTRADTLGPASAYPAITLLVNIAANAPPSVNNLAVVSGGGDVNPGNNGAQDATIIAAGPDLTISKGHSGNFRQGQVGATYAIVARNSGPSPTTGIVTVTDIVPAGLAPSGASGTGWNCNVTGPTVTCTRADALAGNMDYPAITLTVDVANNAPPSIINPVTIAGGGDINPSNNTGEDTTIITPQPDLTISKQHFGSFTQGQQGSYSIIVTNLGDGATTGTVTVIDTLPTALTPTAMAGTGWSCGSVSGQTVTCSRTDALATSSSYPAITLTVNVANNALSPVTNVITVQGGGDINPNNNSDSDPTTINGGPDPGVTSSHTGNFSQGQTGAIYTLTVSNHGPSATVGIITVQDQVPTGLTAVSANGSGWTCNISGQIVTCSRSDPLGGNSAYPSITLTVNVANNAPPAVANTVTVSGGGDVNSNNNLDNDQTIIVPQPDLTISKSHSGNFFQGQQGATYSIVVSNPGGGGTSSTVTINDMLPAGITPVSAIGTGWTCSPPSGQTVSCNRSDILGANAAYPPVTLTVNVANNAPTSITNTVAVSGGGDINPSNNSANDPTTIGAGPDMAISMMHSGNFSQGQQGAAYTIVVRNSGLAATFGIVTVVDPLPPGLTPIGASGTGWNCSISNQNVTCNHSDALPPNTDYPAITLTVNVAVNAPASVTNTAIVSGGGEADSSNNSTSDATTITPQPDLTITKTHTSSFTQGQQGVYSITVSNAGDAASTGTVTVTDTAPSGITPTAASGTGWTCAVPIGQSVTCNRSDALDASSGYPPITLIVSVANNAPGSLTNTVAVSGGGDVNPSNNTASDHTTIGPGPDLTITKTHSGNFNQGQIGAAYSIVVRNSGLAPTTGTVAVADIVPAGLTPTAASGSGWSCAVATQNVLCNRSDALAANADYPPITLTVNVAVNAPASVTNTVTASGGGDVNPNNDTANDATTINPQPDLTILMTNSGNFTQGQIGATYTLVITNVGSGATNGLVTVTDTVPSGLIPTAANGTGWNCAPPNGQTVTCMRGDARVASTDYQPITLSVNVANNSPTPVTNTATVSGGGDINPNNNTASNSTTITAGPDVTVSKSHSGSFNQGQQGANYSIVVRNSGPAATVGAITMTDPVPSGLTPTAASGTGWSCNIAGQNVSCSRSETLAGNSDYPPIALTVNVANNAPASLTNTVTVSGGGDVDSGNNTASDPTTIVPQPDLIISSTHSGSFTQGQQGTYSITVTNSGTGATNGTVTATDTVPAGLTPVAAAGTGWNCGPPSDQTISCTRSDVLAANVSYPPITLTVNVINNAPGSVTNVVTVSGGGDINPNNNTAADPTTIGTGPDLLISKTHSGNFSQGQQGASYSVVVRNSGLASTTGTVTVADAVPSGLMPTSANGTGWSCNVAAQNVTCTRTDSLAAGSAYPSIALTVNVAMNAPSAITNTVTVSGGGDVNSNNNSDDDVTTIVPQPDLTISKTHSGNFIQGQQGANYVITVTNSGAGATNSAVTVTDTVPAGLTPTTAIGIGWNCAAPNGQTVTCSRSSVLAANAAYPSILLKVDVASNAPASVTNTVTVSGGGDANPTNNNASDTATVDPGPDLKISQNTSGNFTQGQQGATYSITVRNSGHAPTSGTIIVVDSLPIGLTPTAASGMGWACGVVNQSITCNRADALAVNTDYAPITLSVNVAFNAPASLTNVVNVAGGGDVDTSNNSASITTTIAPQPDLTISKTHMVSFTQGQIGATYSIIVTNSGGCTTSGVVTVTDTAPAALTPTDATGTGWTCSVIGQTVICARSDVLASNTAYPPITLSVNVANNAPSSVTNTANVSGGGDVNPNNNAASDLTTVGGGPDLTISKTHSGNFNQGQQGATYSIVVRNGGLAPTTGTVTMLDTLPAGLTPVSASGLGWSCETPVGQNISCTRSDALNTGLPYPAITLAVNVAINAPASLTNTATASGGGDVNPNNDTATDATTIIPQPDLTISMNHLRSFTQGQAGANYFILVANLGSAATNSEVTVTDTVPTGLTPVSATGTGWNCSAPSGQTVTCHRSDALAATSAYPPITLTVNVANNAPNAVINTASVSGGGDTNPSNNTISDPTTIGAGPDLTLSKTHSGNFSQSQQGAIYTIVVRNNGLTATTDIVTVVDTIPAELTPISAEGNGWTCAVPSGQSITCIRPDALEPGEAFPSIALKINVAPNAPASVTNSVTVSGGGDVNLSNNTATDPTMIGSLPDLTIIKSHLNNFFQGQNGAVYTISVSNAGTAPTVGSVIVSDTLPTGLVPASASGTGWYCNIAGQAVTCDRSDTLVAGGQYPPFSITTNVAQDAPASVTNTANVSGGGDANPANNTVVDPTTISFGPNLTISKTHTGNFTQGQRGATYTITVRNSGAQATNGQVSVVDTAPIGMTITAAAGSGWLCPPDSTTASCSRTDALAPGASFPPITVTVDVAPDAPASVTNTVTISGGGDLSSADNTASDVTTIGAAPNLTITKNHTGTFIQGQTGASFTLTASNIGSTATAGPVTIVDALPAPLALVAASGAGWACSIEAQTATCSRPDSAPPGVSFPPVTVGVNVAIDAPATLVNVASISGGGDVNNSNNTATDNISIAQGPNIGLTKTHVGNYFIAGQRDAAYTLVVQNTGSVSTTGPITVQDTLPAALSLTAAAGTGWVCTINGALASCSRVDALDSSSSYPPITLTVNVASDAPERITNTATVSGGGNVSPVNATATDTVQVIRGPNLTITKTHSGAFSQGQKGVAYTITVGNNGGSPTSAEVLVLDQLPTGLNPTAATGPGWDCIIGTRGASCRRSDALAVGASYPPITFTVDVAPDAPPSVTNVVRATGGGGTNIEVATASDPTTILGAPDLQITMNQVGDFIGGRQGGFLLTVLNQGTGPTYAPVTATDTLPDALAPVSATGDGWNCSIEGQTVTCGRSDALAEQNNYPAITLTVAIPLTAPPFVVNTATVAGGGELNTTNNTAVESVKVTIPDFSMQIVKQADQQTVQVGDVVSYQVIVTNPSRLLIPITDVTDVPPASFKYVKGTGFLESSKGRQLVEPQVVGSSLIFSLGALPAESSVRLTYRLRVAANAGVGVHVNSATATGTLVPGVTAKSATVSARVRVDAGVFTTSQFVIGRVFDDVNRNGIFEKGDIPVAGVRLFLSNGQSVVTDSEGLYSIPSVGEGAVVISLDPITLPRGYGLVDSGLRSDDSWTRLLRTPLGSGGMLRQNYALTRQGTQTDTPLNSQQNGPPHLLERSSAPGGAVDRLEIVADRSELTADGRDSTVIRIKAFDVNNQPAADGRVLIHVSSGRLIGVETCDPANCSSSTNQGALQEPSRAFQGPSVSAATTAPNGATQTVAIAPQATAHIGQTLVGTGSELVGGVASEQVNQTTQQQAVVLRNGEAQIRLISEATTGKAQVLARLGDAEGTGEVIFVPQQRSTVLVGLAQLSVGKSAPEAALFRNNDTAHEYAKFFFQSPLFNEKNLLTVAYDSNRPINRTSQQDRLFQLNPLDNVYPLFGDSSTRHQAAQSNSHLFVRVDRGLSNVMFGDLRGATSTSFRPNNSFTAYQRNLTGVQLHLEDKEGSYLNAKGARPETAFARDVLPGDLYVFSHVTHQNLLPGSETVVLETRDRRNPEILLNRETLTRSVDYNMDWSIGSIFFLRRIATLDSALNLTQIVISYEYIAEGLTASVYDITGEKRFSSLGLRLGGSFVNQHQDGFGDFYLGGVNGQKDTWKKGIVRFEAATSRGKFESGAGTFNLATLLDTVSLDEHNGLAYRASWEQPLGFASSFVELKAFKTEENFLNPFGPTTVPGTRQESATFKAKPLEGNDLAFGFLEERNDSGLYDNQRLTASALWNQNLLANVKLIAGYNYRKYDDFTRQQRIDSNLLIGGVSWEPTKKLKVGVRREQNLTTADPTYPNTTLLNATYAINETSRLFYTQRLSTAPIVPISNVVGTGLGALASKNDTSVGIETKWSQYTSFGTRYQIENGINGTDSYAVVGLANRLPLNKVLTLDSNFERALHVTGNNTSYNSFSLGVGWFPTKQFRASSRYQLRDQNGFGGSFVVGAAGKISEAMTTLARYQYTREAFQNSNNVKIQGSAAFALRPLKSDRVGVLFNYTLQSFQSIGAGFSALTPTGVAQLPFQGGSIFQSTSPLSGPQKQTIQVLSTDGFLQATARLELFGRLATSFRSSTLAGDPSISTFTYLTQGRIQYRFFKYFDAATELKWMTQPVTDTHQYTTGTELGFWAMRDLRVGLGYNFRSNINYGIDFGDPTIHRGVYFTMTSKMSKIFDLFGTPRSGL